MEKGNQDNFVNDIRDISLIGDIGILAAAKKNRHNHE